jgi:uncharacterized protein with FMN-binding domain
MSEFLRRVAPAVAVTGAAVAVVGLFDPALAGLGADDDTVATSATAAGSESTGGSAGSADSSAGSAGTATATSCDDAGWTDGPTVQTRWGPVQVAARVADGQVCEVAAQVWPDGDGRSVQINAYAIPELDAMASEQGTSFDAISGATVTSEGYRQSLQALLDSLG